MKNLIYEYILEILKLGSFSKAADNLYISQPSLSRAIKSYESKLGIRIFSRAGNKISLTPAGEVLLKYLDNVQQLEKKLKLDLKAVTTIDSANDVLNIGIISWKVPLFLPKIIPEFQTDFPEIKVAPTITDSVSLENKLNHDLLDVAILNGPITSKKLSSVELYNSKLMVLANNSVAVKYLPKKTSGPGKYPILKLKEIEAERLILLNEGFRIDLLTKRMFKHFGVVPQNVIRVDSINSAISLVNVDMGLTFIPEYFIRNNMIDLTINSVFEIEKSSFSLPLNIVFKPENLLNPTIKSFIDYVYERYHE